MIFLDPFKRINADSERLYTLVRLHNLSKDSLHKDVRQFLRGLPINEGAIKLLGNTGEAFVAFPGYSDASDAAERNGLKMGDRTIFVSVVAAGTLERRQLASVRRKLDFADPSPSAEAGPSCRVKRIRPSSLQEIAIQNDSPFFGKSQSQELTDCMARAKDILNRWIDDKENINPNIRRIHPTVASDVEASGVAFQLQVPSQKVKRRKLNF